MVFKMFYGDLVSLARACMCVCFVGMNRNGTMFPGSLPWRQLPGCYVLDAVFAHGSFPARVFEGAIFYYY